MTKYEPGEIVVIPFPFSDLTGAKKRPALVLADIGEKLKESSQSRISRQNDR